MLSKKTKILRWFYKLSWKKIVGFSMFLLVLGVMPLVRNAAINPTRTRSEAALLTPKAEEITKKFEVPEGPPIIYLVDHFFGKVGDAVLIHGENLGGVDENSWVSLGGSKISMDNLINWTGDYIEFKVPNKARSGKVEVSILGKRASWEGMFFVTDENTKAELRLVDNELKAKNLLGGTELLVWLIKVKGEGELVINPVNGVGMSKVEIDLPVGKVYEVKIKISSSLATKSELGLISLLKLGKPEELVVGIARGELSDNQGQLIPLQSHPLYVSF
ncbi:MAG: IPT/TIG domain-containing protein [Patescibacteria group bacterium]|nr:IPT/TIG domain-containing protein [Patescibacteria group bacterium]